MYFSGLGDLTQRDFASAWLHPDVSQHVWAAESGAVVLDAWRWQVLQALRAHEHQCQQWQVEGKGKINRLRVGSFSVT